MDLREGEARPAIEAFFALFGIIAGHTILETARDALFLSALPPSRLSFVYVLLAALTLVVTAANARFVRRFGQRNALIFTLLAAAYGTTVLHFVPLTPAALFVLYTWSALIGTVLGVQFWMFAGQRFTVTQGKRLFGPIAAGGVIGAMTGAGAAAGALAMVPVTSLLLVSAGLFLITAVFLTTVRGVDPRVEPAAAIDNNDVEAPQESVGELLRRYPYLRQMALLTALSTSTLLVGDYLFKSIAAHRVPPAELGAFFARTYAVLNALSLTVQLFLTGRVLRQVGVVPALVILPMLLFGGASGIVFSGGALAMALVVKGADGSLRYSLQRVAGELLWMPLPSDVRTRAKALLDSVFGRLIQAFVAGILLLLATFHLGPPRVLAAIVAVLAAGWIVTTVAMRSSYLDLFRQAISRGTLDLSSEATELDLGSIEAVMDALSSPDPQRVTAAIGILQDKGRSRLIPGLILFHDAEAVLLRALELGLATDRHDWIPLMKSRLLSHPAEAVRAATVRTLVHLGESDAVRPALDDVSPVVRAHAAFNLVTESGAEQPSADPTIRELLALDGDAGRAVAVALLDAIRDHADARWTDVLLELVEDDRPDVAEHAAMAMATIQAPEMIPALIKRLDRREGRASVRQALVLQGDAAFEALLVALADPETPLRRRFHLPRTIARFGTQRAVDVLTDILVKDRQGFVRYKALRGLGRLAAGQEAAQRAERDAGALRFDRLRLRAEMRRNLVEHLRLISVAAALEKSKDAPSGNTIAAGASLVLGLLGDKQRQSLERAFRLLQILHRDEDIRSAHAALVTGDRRLRGQAMEFLDTLTLSRGRPTPEAREVRELLRLIADDLPTADRVERALAFIPRPPATYEDAVVKLMADRDDLLATFAAYHALDIGTPRLVEAVTRICVERPYLNIATPLGARAEQSMRGARLSAALEVVHGR
jgi:ATP:ADP antiporter, AAA family